MKEVILDGARCTDRKKMCAALALNCGFPEECGHNLDALHDLLTASSEDIRLTILHPEKLEQGLGQDYACRLLRMLRDSARENEHITVRMGRIETGKGRTDNMTVENANTFGSELEQRLLLRYSPIALKLLYSEDEIPEGTIRPVRDEGNRLAMCQAFALVRRNRKAYTMLKDDHWCVWPLVSYRICPMEDEDYVYMGTKFFMKDPQRGVKFLKEEYPFLKDKAPIGFSIAPLRSCTFVPDLVCIYCTPAQIRSLLMATKYITGDMLDLTLDPVDSCVHSTIPVLNGKDFNITFPDPGEYERGLTDENEVMFTLRSERLEELVESLKRFDQIGMSFQKLRMEMSMNFPRPPFYEEMFKKWGLATGPLWGQKGPAKPIE